MPSGSGSAADASRVQARVAVRDLASLSVGRISVGRTQRAAALLAFRSHATAAVLAVTIFHVGPFPPSALCAWLLTKLAYVTLCAKRTAGVYKSNIRFHVCKGCIRSTAARAGLGTLANSLMVALITNRVRSIRGTLASV